MNAAVNRKAEKVEYLSSVTDAYSKRVMRYNLADHLKATGPIEAFKMAISNREYPKRKLMHHSGKGFIVALTHTSHY